LTIFQKAAFSLLLSIFLFAGIAVLAYTGLFDLLETRFYNPSIATAMMQETGRDAELIGNLLFDLQKRFASSLENSSVRQSFLSRRNIADLSERAFIYDTLLESVAGLHSVRFVDSSGEQIYFSTHSSDIISQDRFSITYRAYHEDPSALSFDKVQVPVQGSPRLVLDDAHGRIIFSFPFYDSLDIYRGTALFALSLSAAADQLISRGRINAGEHVAIVAVPPGIIVGLPMVSMEEIIDKVASIWDEGFLGPGPLAVSGFGLRLALVSAKTSQGIYCGRIVNEDVFIFPQSLKIILLASIFLTIYLAIFFSFNIRQDSMIVMQSRLIRLRTSLVEEFYEHKDNMDLSRWTWDIEQRREDIRTELKKKVQKGWRQYSEDDIDELVDRTWDELLVLTSESPSMQKMACIPPLTGNTADAAFENLEELEAVGDEAENTAPITLVKQDAEKPPVENPAVFYTRPEYPGGLLALATRHKFRFTSKHKQSNVQLAFGDDDIPYLVESSGLELVDEDIDQTIRSMHDGEYAELEELESMDKTETANVSPGHSRFPEQDIAKLASEIEFSPLSEAEENEEAIDATLEVVSPFSSILSSMDKTEEKAGEAIELAAYPADLSLSIAAHPFMLPVNDEPELLEGPDTDDPSTVDQAADKVIVQHNGIHYINSDIINHETKTGLNNQFKELVESVLDKKN
jgi:hypothetical protein